MSSQTTARPPKSYRFDRRWRLSLVLNTCSPLHVGTGEIVHRPGLVVEKPGEAEIRPCDVQAVACDHDDVACIPGSALKGVLRSWAETFFPDHQKTINRVFGRREVDQKDAVGGALEFLAARLAQPTADPQFVPYWDPQRGTGVVSHVAIDRESGAAEPEKLFYEEYVPVGTQFAVTLFATNLSADDLAFVLAVLDQGSRHPTHTLALGANGRNGWGRVEELAEQRQVTCVEPGRLTLADLQARMGHECGAVTDLAPVQLTPAKRPHVTAELTLRFAGPFLVNDTSRTKRDDMSDEEKKKHTNFTPLRREDGRIWLPATSFRGALRQRAEFLLESLNGGGAGINDQGAGPDDGPIERIFGKTSQASRLRIEEFREVDKCELKRQDLVAIDRFTGGAADLAKFDVCYADRPVLQTRLTLELDGLEQGDIGLLALVVRDVCEGRITFGFGGAKGYGACTGAITSLSCAGAAAAWELPDSAAQGQLDDDAILWLEDCIARLVDGASIDEPTADAAAATEAPAVETGTLEKTTSKRGKTVVVLHYQTAKGPKKDLSGVEHRLAPSLEEKLPDLPDGSHDVEFGPGRRMIRLVGDPIAAAGSTTLPPAEPGRFYHPYYFLRLEERESFGGELADHRPVGHKRWQPALYSGSLRVRLTTKTPLLICDDGDGQDQHATYGVRQQDGKPLLATTSVRGMLRAAYEAITNSRFGVFPGSSPHGEKLARSHGRRLGFREQAEQGVDRVPVRIARRDGKLVAQLLPGPSGIDGGGGAVRGQPLFAAWCGYYGNWKPPGLNGLAHGQQVWAYVTPWHYRRETKSGRAIEFRFWNVEELQPYSATEPTTTPSRPRPKWNNAQPAAGDKPHWRAGYLCATGLNIRNKHDERVFLFGATQPDGSPVEAALGPGAVARWDDLISDYQAQHEKDVKAGMSGPRGLGSHVVFSRHVSHVAEELASKELAEGTLCYAELRPSENDQFEVTALYPVVLSRKLNPLSPLDVLPPSLRPAARYDQLSPADRVFGWVNQDGTASTASDDPVAYRGQVRLGPVTCESDDPIETFAPRVLPILGQPKPAQGRFYLGDANGRPQSGQNKEQAGYRQDRRIRGPKVYPHQPDFKKERVRSTDASQQNRSITGWVREDVDFDFDIEFTNLSAVELGGLVWLLSLPDDHYLRLGLGKPLGFGSVRATILSGGDEGDSTGRVARGTDWTRQYMTWERDQLKEVETGPLVEQYTTAIDAVHPDLRQAFLKAAAGCPGDVHYPLLPDQQTLEHFEWFVQNDRGSKVALPDLLDSDPTLPRRV